MAKNPVLNKTLLKSMALVALAPLLFGGLFWAVGEYRSAQIEAQDLRKKFIQNRRELLIAEVGSVVSYIKSAKARLEEQSRERLKQRVDLALQMARGIHHENRGQKSPREIKKLIKEALRTIRFDRGRDSYFVISLDDPGEFRPGLGDGSDRFAPSDVVAQVKRRGESFYRYWGKKPGHRSHLAKIAYVKLFEPHGWIIGSGKYLDEMQDEIQSQVLSNVSEMRFGTEGYYFACDYKGNPLFSNGNITKGGKNIWDLNDPNGVKIIQEQVAAALKPDGGFYYYSWPKLNGPGAFSKMSFVVGLPEWQWAVGAGVYLDTINREIAKRERDLWSRLASRAVEGCLLMVLFLMLTYLWADRIAKRINQSLKTFSGFFQKAGSRSAQIDLDRVHFREFKDMARWANQMVADRKKQEKEKESLEARLRQSQKMEAIGTLAGGIAHDFNNILAAIMGYAELSLEDCRTGGANPEYLENILEASMRAKELVRGILAFSRNTGAGHYTLDLNQEVRTAAEILERTLPRMINLETSLDPGLGPILGDSGQIQQILLNLASNSKDAMPGGGRIKLETFSLHTDRVGFQADQKAMPEYYAVLRVSDTGQGIPTELREQIFDPFFTTKEVGKGTGLGLSTVYGIVRSHQGHIECRRHPGQGTEFAIYFPVSGLYLPPPGEGGDPAGPDSGGDETILLVDDEKAIREIGARLLAGAGYRPLTAESGERALDIYQRETVDLVVLDLDMPGMGGEGCLHRLFRLDPGVKVVIASGHAGERKTELMRTPGVKDFVAKPYLKKAFLRVLRDVLDGGGK